MAINKHTYQATCHMNSGLKKRFNFGRTPNARIIKAFTQLEDISSERNDLHTNNPN